jgi:hypothetical protein
MVKKSRNYNLISTDKPRLYSHCYKWEIVR